MKRKILASFAFLQAACLFAASAYDEYEIGKLLDEARRFKHESASLAVQDLSKNPYYDTAKHKKAVDTLGERKEWVVKQLSGAASKERDEAAGIVQAYRDAMLANPLLDGGKILCVRRKLKNPTWPAEKRGVAGGSDYPYKKRNIARSLGLLGLNAHNHMDMNRKGFTNDIAVITDFRTKPVFESLYAPEDTSLVRDIDLDFDASRILFTSYRGTNNLFGVYEIKKGSKEATLVSPEDGHYDIQWWDGCYLPNKDQIVLLGTGAYQFLPCEDGNFPMCVIYRIDRKTGKVVQLTFEQDSDYTPTVLNDGRIAFTRWEYSDLQHYFSRELMTMNPDGVGQLALWGSGSYFPTFFCGARAIPGDSSKLVLMAGGHHGRAEHGRMLLLDPSLARKYPVEFEAPDREWGPPKHPLRIPVARKSASETGFVHEFPGRGEMVEGDICDLQVDNQFARGKPYFSHPWPLDGKYYLASAKCSEEGRFGIYLVDIFDNMTLIAEIEDGALFEPMPYEPRKRPPVIPDRSVPGEKNCTVHIADIYNGEGLKGVPRGTVKKLRVFSYHFCYHKTGGHVSTGLDRVEAGWDVKRVLGTVDVEEDGSVCFEMPANTPVSFQPLDKNGAAVQLMRTWAVGMPGERVSCTGCHEDNRTSVPSGRAIADRKPIQKIKPPDGDGVRPWGFATELWPHIVASCAGCHEKAPCTNKPPFNIKAFNVATPENAYRFLHPYIRRGGAESELQVLTPMEFHASTSPLVQMLEKGHHGARLSDDGWRQLYTWIDLNCVYRGKWGPSGFKNNSFLPGTTNQIARRLELTKRYASIEDDPEKEFDEYAAKVEKRGKLPVVKPRKIEKGNLPEAKLEEGWPMTRLESAAWQLGMASEIAPVTVKTLVLGDGCSMTFRRIPAGKYVMGSKDGYCDETPRVVHVKRPFWISETEVENGQYKVFDKKHSSRAQDQWGYDQVMPGHIGTHRRQPAVRVSRNEAEAFCKWLSGKCGVKASLPSEEEWEWAARAGTATPFPWGGLDDDFGKYANFADSSTRWMYSTWDMAASIQTRRPYKSDMNYPLRDDRFEDDWFTINFTARGRTNWWGLYDMHGNAAEWTSTTVNGKAVVRGGAFDSRPKDATSSFKQYYLPWQKVYNVGFRVVLEDDSGFSAERKW